MYSITFDLFWIKGSADKLDRPSQEQVLTWGRDLDEIIESLNNARKNTNHHEVHRPQINYPRRPKPHVESTIYKGHATNNVVVTKDLDEIIAYLNRVRNEERAS